MRSDRPERKDDELSLPSYRPATVSFGREDDSERLELAGPLRGGGRAEVEREAALKARGREEDIEAGGSSGAVLYRDVEVARGVLDAFPVFS